MAQAEISCFRYLEVKEAGTASCSYFGCLKAPFIEINVFVPRSGDEGWRALFCGHHISTFCDCFSLEFPSLVEA